MQGAGRRLEAVLAVEANPDAEAERHEQLAALAAALARLPDDERQALEWKHLEGWPVKQIAQQLGRSEAGAAGLLRRGLGRLRSLMGANPAEAP